MAKPQWVNEKEVARITSISVNTLRANRRKQKGIPYSKDGKSVLYSIEDIQAYMLEHRIDPAAVSMNAAPLCTKKSTQKVL